MVTGVFSVNLWTIPSNGKEFSELKRSVTKCPLVQPSVHWLALRNPNAQWEPAVPAAGWTEPAATSGTVRVEWCVCLCPLPTAIDLLYWRDIKQTGIVFGSFLLLLFSLTQFSVVSVVAYLALAALSATISFRIYKSVLQAVQKTDEGHPFK